MAGLTIKQEAFVLAYIETGNASEAYRRAYNAENTKPDVVHVKASELLANGKVAVRVAELKAAHAQQHEITVERIAQMLLEDRTFARESGTPAAAVSATMGLAKLGGLLTDKVDHKSSDGSMSPAIDPSKLSTGTLREIMAARSATDAS